MSAADIRVFRQKIDSTASMKKIFNAMELIATSRIGKARQRVAASMPYANAITRAVSAVSSQQDIEHVLMKKTRPPISTSLDAKHRRTLTSETAHIRDSGPDQPTALTLIPQRKLAKHSSKLSSPITKTAVLTKSISFTPSSNLW